MTWSTARCCEPTEKRPEPACTWTYAVWQWAPINGQQFKPFRRLFRDDVGARQYIAEHQIGPPAEDLKRGANQ